MGRRFAYYCIGLLAVLASAPSQAHRTHGPARSHLFTELQSIGRQLGYARDQLSDHLDISTKGAAKTLSSAEVELLGGDPVRAAARLLKLLSRPGIEETPAYPEALSWLGRALVELEFAHTAAAYLAQSLEPLQQTPSAYRRRLRVYLRHGARYSDLETTSRAWRRTLRDPPIYRDRHESELRYLYARALYFHGDLAAAKLAFEAIDERDAFSLHALYFLGVIALGEDDLLTGKKRFEQARTAWLQRMKRFPPLPISLDEISQDGPRRAAHQLKGGHKETGAQEKALRRIGAVIHLALARLAAHQGKNEEAWQLYRRVPPGDPDAITAQREAAFVLARMGELRWGARVVQQLATDRGVDADAVELGLWRGQMLARDAAYEASRRHYREITETLNRERPKVELASQTDALFPPAIVDWTAPARHDVANKIAAMIREQEVALAAAKSTAELLESFLNTEDALPTVAHGRRVAVRVKGRTTHFEGHLREVEALRQQAVLNPALARTDLPTDIELNQMNQSVNRLRQRLEHYERQLGEFERHYRTQIARLVATEVPRLRALQARLATETTSARALADELRRGARAQLAALEARALFGQVDIAFWKKQAATQRLREAAETHAKGLKALAIPPDGAARVTPIASPPKKDIEK